MDERNGSEFRPRGQDVIKVFSLSLIIENCRLSLTPKIKPYLLVFRKAVLYQLCSCNGNWPVIHNVILGIF